MTSARLAFAAGVAMLWGVSRAGAGDLTVDLGTAQPLASVGAIRRWEVNGTARFPVDPKARIDAPRTDAQAVSQGGGRWVFRGLPPGHYDLVVLTSGRVRVEGFRYPPIAEFDPFLPPDARPPDEEDRDVLIKQVARSPHYENKVAPLFLAAAEGGAQVRLLVQLVRDKPTSYDAEFGAPAATIRHEVWQFTNRHGGWVKERRTEVLDRVLLARSDLHRWTWIWEPRLGGIEIKANAPAVSLSCPLPERFDPAGARGWFPD